MRFNGRELANLAQEAKLEFDKEGLLKIKEKQEGLFRKGEVFVDRWFRLRGNLLFYFKGKDATEAIGVIVMERCAVELDPREELPYSFILVFEGDEKVQTLAAKSERERDSWIESLHIASYECLKMQLESLRDQLRLKTGKDPIDHPDPSQVPEHKAGALTETGEPFLEMCFTCDGLPTEVNGKPPSTFVSVSFMMPPAQHWTAHAHTEVVERQLNPCYLTTIGFSDRLNLSLATKIRLIVYVLKERMTSTGIFPFGRTFPKESGADNPSSHSESIPPALSDMIKVGSTIFTVTDLLTAPGCRLRHRLNSDDYADAGNIVIMGWQNDQVFDLESLNGPSSQDSQSTSNVPSTLSRTPSRGKTKRLEMLRPLYANVITKTYRFPTNADTSGISVHEYMGESKLTYWLPRQLLKLWVDDEKNRIEQLQDLGELGEEWNRPRQEMTDFCMSSVSMYTQAARHLAAYKGPPFKPSTKKGSKEIEFAPTNLHLQRMWVVNDTKRSCGCYDIMTVGAFTAYTQKYKHGGLRRLIQQLRDTSREYEDGRTRLDKVNEIINNLTVLKLAVHTLSEAVCRAAVQGDSAELNNCMSMLSDKTRQLLQVCESPLVEMGIARFAEAKRECMSSRPQSYPGAFLNTEPVNRDPSPEKSWKWSGTDFVKSPTEEPWDMTRLNTEAAIMCVLAKVEEVLQKGTEDEGAAQWLPLLSPLIIKLERAVEVTYGKARAALTLLSIEESSSNIPLLHTIKYRRDIVFSQTLTAAVAAFMTKLRGSMADETFLQQLSQIGVLLYFESLLSCHGDELGMIEDMAVGVQDLSHVVFKVVQHLGPDDILPQVKGNRTGYTIQIPVPEHMFQLMPKEIQRGHPIRVVPVLFTIGINEQATFAERWRCDDIGDAHAQIRWRQTGKAFPWWKDVLQFPGQFRFGDLSVQEAVNAESWQRLNAYWEKYSEIIGEPDNNDKGSFPMEQLMRHLYINVMSKKSKNVDVLTMSQEVCRRLCGVRFTSCKSAKDRTAMAVTLEQAQLLQREHDLASHVFMHALECMRSEGVRRDNTTKNTGTRKYAFNSLQLLSLPKLYRPPNGTFGNVQT